ncbi:LOW QUALITY PROTEIN: coatomer subunit gamma-2-like [Homarus americanus]|uniref:LOW QUALITY PROTEIN: coatomer subunit gamma-2-like n=1 Tax=Homarus americanus TaxID=6706 RepID=UPI001C43F06B|nr:LOW QUALITY PROTEIN: coatomer subunit gamma-2-like [Homarus americanus]
MIGSFKQMKKDEEDGGGNPYHSMDKTSVLQEARVFNETPVNVKRSTHVLTKILYLLNQGESLATKEATDAFFAMTKLFQSNDLVLRLCYLGIKELCAVAEDTIIVTSSLTKDMTGREDQYRAPAIRALCRITDVCHHDAIERYMKQAIVDRAPGVSSAALVSCRHIMKDSPDVVKRWVSEVQEALSSDCVMVQFHALGVLHQIRKSDKLAVTKMVSKLTSSSLRSPYAICLLIRIVARLIEEDEAGADSRLFDFLESMLRHKAEMVIYEAANAIVTLRKSSARDLAPAISVLQLFLSSPKPTLRFAAVRTLSKVAMTQPNAVTACNLDLENLIQDVNRSIATLAITTLLKTGSEGSVDRLMKSISSFLNDISDEFKIVVVEALRALALKYPRKQAVLMGQLADMLRSEGGLPYKEAIASTIITIIEDNPEAKEKGLDHLCEFIEDCEHTTLAVRIIHLLGREGPRTRQPARYIRFVYNRVILENAAVRAAAVSVLAKFGAQCDSLLNNILVLLQRCMMDTEDEVRDRATYYHAVLATRDSSLINQYILNPPQFALPSLERALVQYLRNDTSGPFDTHTVPTAPPPQEEKTSNIMEPAPRPEERIIPTHEKYAEMLSAIPQFVHLGPLFKSSVPLELTEAETEYMVRCIKHTFQNHIVLQFDCTNTLNDQLLERVSVVVEGDGWDVEVSLPCPSLPYSQLGSCYALLPIPEDIMATTGTLSATLKFKVRDCDPVTGEPDTDEGYEDDYTLEDVEITVVDHVQRAARSNFAAGWEELGATNELEDTFALSAMSTLEEAVTQITQFLGMHPCDRSDRIPEGKSAHTLYLAGTYRGGHEVLVRAKLALADGVTMQLTVRSDNPEVSEVIASAVG